MYQRITRTSWTLTSVKLNQLYLAEGDVLKIKKLEERHESSICVLTAPAAKVSEEVRKPKESKGVGTAAIWATWEETCENSRTAERTESRNVGA